MSKGRAANTWPATRKFADYVLYQEPGVPIAVVEAKDNNCTVSQGLQQALGYAEILDVPSAYSSNGDAFASHNKVPGAGEDTCRRYRKVNAGEIGPRTLRDHGRWAARFY